MTSRTAHKFVYDHRGEIVTLADVAWGDSYADQQRAARQYADLIARRQRGEYVPTLTANAGAWSITVDLAAAGIRGEAVPVREEPVKGRTDAREVIYRVDSPRDADGSVDFLGATVAIEQADRGREIKRVGNVLWVRTVVIDLWPGASEVPVEEPPF